MSKESWNNRFSQKEYVYGTQPNIFFKKSIEQYSLSGKILLPAEGEGRNAVYAAKNKFQVTAIDISQAGKTKAENLAKQENVNINYIVDDFYTTNLPQLFFDVAALIFAHFPNDIARQCHRKIANALKPNGHIIIEYFTKGHTAINSKTPEIGGPRSEDRLLTLEEIKEHFYDFEILHSGVFQTSLSEGTLHNGIAKVNRFIGRKKV